MRVEQDPQNKVDDVRLHSVCVDSSTEHNPHVFVQTHFVEFALRVHIRQDASSAEVVFIVVSIILSLADTAATTSSTSA